MWINNHSGIPSSGAKPGGRGHVSPNRGVSGFCYGEKLGLMGSRASNVPKSMDVAVGDQKRSSTFLRKCTLASSVPPRGSGPPM